MSPDIFRVDTLADLDEASFLVAEAARNHTWLAFDLETRSDATQGGLEDWHDSSRIVSVGLASQADRAIVIPLSHPAAPWADHWKAIATELFESLKGARLIAQFGLFDSRWVRSRTGVDLGPYLAWDTKDGSYVLDESQPNGLKIRAEQDLGVPPWADNVDLEDAETLPWEDLSRYNGLDAAHTWHLFDWQRNQFRTRRELGRVFWHIHMPTIRALSQVVHNGMLLDPDETRRLATAAEEEHTALAAEIADTVPQRRVDEFTTPKGKYKPSLAATSTFFKAYALDQWPILECTDSCEKHGTGDKPHPQPKWDASVLKRLAPDYPTAQLVLDYRKLDKKLTTYLRRWPTDVHEDGRLRPTYRTTSTVTGRPTCQNPNLLNVDRKLKTCFKAPEGFSFIQVDYSQIELRIAAHLSQDEALLQVYREGGDVHVTTAAAVLGKPPEDVEEEERYRAKAVNFGLIYGQLPPGFVKYARDVYGVKFTLKEAEEAHERYFRQYPGLVTYHNLQRREVHRNKYVTNMFGRVRRLPMIDSPLLPDQWRAERQAINAPIQSAASDLLLLALARVNEEVPEARLVGTVYDSIMFEVPNDAVDGVVERIGRIMVTPADLWSGLLLTVPLEVEFEVGERWNDPNKKVFTMTGEV